MKTTSLEGTTITREIRIGKRDIDTEARTVDLAFSSDKPLERQQFFGGKFIEVLSHEPGAARLERLNSGGALLMDHNSRDQVGVVEDARLDPDGVGRATVRFSSGERGSEVFRDVVEEIRSLVSVGFLVHKEEITHGEGGAPDQFRITDWEPLEVSLVAVPADASVGVGRAFEDRGEGSPAASISGHTITLSWKPEQPSTEGDHHMSKDALAPAATPAPDAVREQEPLAAAATPAIPADTRTKDDADIRALGTRFGYATEAEEHVDLGATPEQFRQFVIARQSAKAAVPMDLGPAGGRDIEIHNRHTLRRDILAAFGPDRRTQEANAYEAGMWGRAVVFGDDKALRWCRDRMGERAMAGGIPSKGGVLVPDVLSNAIIDLREQYGVARQLCKVWPMGSDTLTIARRTGGTTATWTGENVAITAADAAFDSVTLVAKKLMALTLVSTELAEDSIIDIGGHLAGEHAWAFSKAEDDAWIDGDGTSTYGGIFGMRPKIVDGNHTAGAVDAVVAGEDTFAEITAPSLAAVSAALPLFASGGARWLSSKSAKSLTFDRLAAAAGGTTMTMVGGAPEMSYLGDQIVLQQSMPAGATNLNNVVMLFYGRFDLACAFGDRRGFTLQVLSERYAELGQIGIIANERVDIVTHDLGDTSTAGPVVALIGFTS